MPPLRSLAARILLQVAEGTAIPAFVFWAVLHLTGLVPALLAGLAWCYGAIARRRLRGGPMPTVLLVGALLFTTRTVVAMAFHSAFIFLLTPTISAFVLAAAFAGSAAVRRPLTARFARDFMGLPVEVSALSGVHTALRRLSLIWALAYAVNGAVALQLLMADHYDAVLLARSVMTPALSAIAVLCCLHMGRRALRAEGIHLHLRWRDGAPALA